MSATKPLCLLRSAADDREEARLSLDDPIDFDGDGYREAFDAALAAIQRREATQVMMESSATFPRLRLTPFMALSEAADRIAERAHSEAHTERLTLDQRARLLDAARMLVALALEVAS